MLAESAPPPPMIDYPRIDPVLVSFGPLAVRWYGLAYLAGFAFAWWYGRRRARALPGWWHPDELGDLVFYGALGAVLGGRIGYVLFYGMGFWAQDWLYPLRIWEGGMSFHGGLLGVGAALALYARRTGRRFVQVADFATPLVPVGLGCGRLGNFVNAELPGRVTDVPWAFVFPGEAVGRHPSSLYQAFTEGVVLFLILWAFRGRALSPGFLTGLFLAAYGALRFVTEFFRTPDAHLGFVAFGWMTMGQILCLPMVAAGIALLVAAHLGLTGEPRRPSLPHAVGDPEHGDGAPPSVGSAADPGAPAAKGDGASGARRARSGKGAGKGNTGSKGKKNRR
jgi:phosphatidylglycerol:prolipoprotein diacylglycerol transferase